MNTTTTKTFGAHRDREARALTAAAALVCGLGVASALSTTIEHAIGAVIATVLALAVLAVLVRLALRWVRERCEDAADARTASAWRVAHNTARSAVSVAVGTAAGQVSR